MSDQIRPFERFIASNLKAIVRIHLLDKPCVQCHRGTDIRVNLPTCSHRVCSRCLAQYEVLGGGGTTIACPTCSSYWFTLRPKDENTSEREESGSDLSLQIDKKSQNIERHIRGEMVHTDELNVSGGSSEHVEQAEVSEMEGLDSSPSATSNVHGVPKRDTPVISEVQNALEDNQSSEDLDKEALNVQAEWDVFKAGLNAMITGEPNERRDQKEFQQDLPAIAENPASHSFREALDDLFEPEDTEECCSSSSSTAVKAALQKRNRKLRTVIPARPIVGSFHGHQEGPTAAVTDTETEDPNNALCPAVLIVFGLILFEIGSLVVIPAVVMRWKW